MPKEYDESIKLDALRMVLVNGYSAQAVAKIKRLPLVSLQSWLSNGVLVSQVFSTQQVNTQLQLNEPNTQDPEAVITELYKNIESLMKVIELLLKMRVPPQSASPWPLNEKQSER